jgi:hypothetical protein
MPAPKKNVFMVIIVLELAKFSILEQATGCKAWRDDSSVDVCVNCVDPSAYDSCEA